jgi:primase-polymerase (primpol)-like protein
MFGLMVVTKTENKTFRQMLGEVQHQLHMIEETRKGMVEHYRMQTAYENEQVCEPENGVTFVDYFEGVKTVLTVEIVCLVKMDD